MTSFIIGRLMQAVVVILLLTLVVFSLLRLTPGDPILQILGPYADRQTMEDMRERLGFNQSVPEQYGTWLGKVVRGDLGESIITRQSVTGTLKWRIPVTLQIALGALAVSVIIGLPAGIIAALARNRWPDYFLSIFAVAGIAMPSFWLALILIVVFSVHLGWLPTSGFVSPRTDLWRSFQLSIMPWFVAGRGWRGSADASDTVRFVRSARAGLRPHSEGEGPHGANSNYETRFEECDDPGVHYRGTSGGKSPGRNGHCGVRFWNPRDGQTAR